jgi:PAS domain S-box-containing protein
MLWINKAFARETGLSVEDFGFRNQQNPFIHPDDLPHVVAELGAFIDSAAERSAPILNRFIDAWGHTRSLSTVVHKIRWQDEPALLLISTMSRVETAELDASYRQLVEQAEDGILKLGQDGTIVYSNRRFQGMVHRHPVEISRRPFHGQFHAEDQGHVRAALERLAAGETRVTSEGRLITARGTIVWVSLVLNPLGALDPAAAYLVIARDVTEERQLEAHLRQRQRLEGIGVLVSGIAHDLNNIGHGRARERQLRGVVVPSWRHPGRDSPRHSDRRRAGEDPQRVTSCLRGASPHAIRGRRPRHRGG